ncbi:MAG: hypothetical protein JSR73_19570 [Proteobacteria bacterium]|nr:hypothetical protein [Pseudomonadota bacterium]
MASPTTLLVLRILHLVAGTLWTGGAVFIAAFVLPAVRSAGPPGGAVMRALTRRGGAADFIAVLALVTIASGGYLLWIDSAGLDAGWLATGWGRGIAWGALATIAAFLLGILHNLPTAYALGRLGAPSDAAGRARAARLGRRLALGTGAVAVLLVLATIAMAAARRLG